MSGICRSRICSDRSSPTLRIHTFLPLAQPPREESVVLLQPFVSEVSDPSAPQHLCLN
jgi:hypothetical protein